MARGRREAKIAFRDLERMWIEASEQAVHEERREAGHDDAKGL
jgi:hypothetical protein